MFSALILKNLKDLETLSGQTNLSVHEDPPQSSLQSLLLSGRRTGS